MNKRPENWPDLLAAHLTFWASQPFTWGSCDCAHFAASWLTLLGYRQPMAGLPLWQSPLGAWRLYRALGGFEHGVGAQLGALGCPRIAPALASRGDLVIVRNGRRQLIAIANGQFAVAHGDRVSVNVPLLENAVAVWKV